MKELFSYAITGGNIIPTVLLILVVLYWLTVIIGALDLDFLDIDLDAGDTSGPFYAMLAFLKVGNLPFMLVFSVLILNFWIISMLMHYLPIASGGGINTLLLLPALVFSLFITKYELLPFKGIFKKNSMQEDTENVVLRQLCRLKSDVSIGRLGQAEVERDGASVILTVKPEFEEDSFHKDEIACVFRKDEDKDIYYIVKVEGVI